MRKEEAYAAYERFNTGSLMRKAIVEAPGSAIGTVVDIVVDEIDKVGHATEAV